MHESRAKLLALICLVLVAGGFIYGILGYRSALIRLANEAAARELAAKARIEAPPPGSLERYVSPAPITFPFF